MTENEPYDFDEDGVQVKLPEELKHLKVKREKFEKDKPKPFDLIRVVANIKLEDENGTLVTKFDPPFELRVRYIKSDKDAADKPEKKKLKLAYWDGDNWICFTKKKHEFSLIKDQTGDEGVGIAKIKEWPDPPIAWGK